MLTFITELPPSPFTLNLNPHGIYMALNQPGYIYYTLDGSTPTLSSSFISNYSSLMLYGACTLKFFGVTNGDTERTQVYTVDVRMPAVPVITKPAFYTNEFHQWGYFYLVSPIPVKFYFTTDGSIPTELSQCVNAAWWATATGTTWYPSLRVIAIDQWNRKSAVYEAGALFTAVTGSAVVSTDKAPGAYKAGTTIALVADKVTDQIFYTLDGTAPLLDNYGTYYLPRAGSTTLAYTGPLTLETVLDIRAMCWWAGTESPATTTMHFIADTANSSLRLPRGQEGSVPTHTTDQNLLIASDANSLFIADEVGNTHQASDMHTGPDQPLGTKKIWNDTATMTMKVNNGVEWVPSAMPVTPNQIKRDFGGFVEATGPSFVVGEWTDITDIQFWDPQPGLDQEINGEFIGGEWVDTQDWGEVWLVTIGSWVYENDAWTWMADRIVTAEEYAMMDYWWKGLRFSKIRVWFETLPGDNTSQRLEVYTNEYNDLVWVSSSTTTNPLTGDVGEIPVSGKEYDVVWPDYSTPGFMSDFGGIDSWGGAGITKFTKIEILVSQVGG